ncbi:MAG: methyltransferase domain-containing protein, partial [Acidobacteria bacterium]|nr:methyltransferase domain-containing protein [Acidobacteriota bacterium]
EAWLDVTSFIGHLERHDFIRTSPFPASRYPGRQPILGHARLDEIWLHITNRCNLSCEHCLVASSPSGIEGLSTERWLDVVREAKRLGATQFYITGGEPFARSDIAELIGAICDDAELIVLTNAMLFPNGMLGTLREVANGNLRLQISVDGPEADSHDLIRGPSFAKTIAGIRAAIEAGYEPTVSTVVTQSNLKTLSTFPKFLAEIGVRRHHLLWSHKRGRAAEHESMLAPDPRQIIPILEIYLEEASVHGIELDNYAMARERVEGRTGVKVDLSGAGVTSLCVYADGAVYPSAALAGAPELRMGNVAEQRLETIWKESLVSRDLRRASVLFKKDCSDCHLRFICGGGDVEHSYVHTGSFVGEDPYSAVHEWLLMRAISDVVEERRRLAGRSGYDSPVVIAAMGEALSDIETLSYGSYEITMSRSNCVLSVDLDRSRRNVREFYAGAAVEPQASLCCPAAYDPEDLKFLPREVVEVSYGCGSPVRFADLNQGETYVDLGSGGGIDCFIAARRLGSSGRVIGVDMTPEMIQRAERNRPQVANLLGYDTVEFRSGYLENIPVEAGAADIVTSNCVINLSPDKRRVLSEMWRILKNNGRAIISDTVTDSPLPRHMKANPRLWGECVSGALTEEEYFALLEQTGFYGLTLLEKKVWKEIEGHRFFSVVIRAYKFAKNGVCNFIGQKAIYLGPLKAVIDEEGHLFPRNEAVEICTDTALKLSRPPYAGSFLVIGEGTPDATSSSLVCCEPGRCC